METKLKNFINKWLNKYLEVVDATNKNQCFDLVVGWCDELGLPRVFPHLYAYQIYTVDTDDKKKYFDKIANTSDAYPQAGDIVVWSKSYNGTAGHTAVATGVHQTQGKSTDWFEAFTQNDPTGSPCILKKYSYNNVLGWLRPKKEYIKLDNYYKGIDLSNLESLKVCVDTWYDVAVANLYLKKEEHERVVKEKEATIQNLNTKINELEKKIITNLTETNELKKQYEAKIETLANDLQLCQKSKSIIEEDYNKLKNVNELLKQAEEDKERLNEEIKKLNVRLGQLQERYDKLKKPTQILAKYLLDKFLGKI